MEVLWGTGKASCGKRFRPGIPLLAAAVLPFPFRPFAVRTGRGDASGSGDRTSTDLSSAASCSRIAIASPSCSAGQPAGGQALGQSLHAGKRAEQRAGPAYVHLVFAARCFRAQPAARGGALRTRPADSRDHQQVALADHERRRDQSDLRPRGSVSVNASERRRPSRPSRQSDSAWARKWPTNGMASATVTGSLLSCRQHRVAEPCRRRPLPTPQEDPVAAAARAGPARAR